MKTGHKIKRIKKEEAISNLIKAAELLVKEARWAGYRTKINELRIPLIQIRHPL